MYIDSLASTTTVPQDLHIPSFLQVYNRLQQYEIVHLQFNTLGSGILTSPIVIMQQND